MEQFFEFVANHPLLVGAFLVLLTLFVVNEMNRGGRKVSPQEVVNLVNREDAIVVDLRDRKEYEQGHIVDAINIPYASLGERMSELEPYKERPIILACKMGQHAGAAGATLRKAGFTNVRRLSGGMSEWRGSNLPVVKSD